MAGKRITSKKTAKTRKPKIKLSRKNAQYKSGNKKNHKTFKILRDSVTVLKVKRDNNSKKIPRRNLSDRKPMVRRFAESKVKGTLYNNRYGRLVKRCDYSFDSQFVQKRINLRDETTRKLCKRSDFNRKSVGRIPEISGQGNNKCDDNSSSDDVIIEPIPTVDLTKSDTSIIQ